MSGTVVIPAQKVQYAGPFGRTMTLTIPGQNVPVTVSAQGRHAELAIPDEHLTPEHLGRVGLVVPWAAIIALVVQFGAKVLPIILADVAAGKTFPQIIADILASLHPIPPLPVPVPVPAPTPTPTQLLATQYIHILPGTTLEELLQHLNQ
jgi:hypothetical protein